jgi:hypothetical protein
VTCDTGHDRRVDRGSDRDDRDRADEYGKTEHRDHHRDQMAERAHGRDHAGGDAELLPVCRDLKTDQLPKEGFVYGVDNQDLEWICRTSGTFDTVALLYSEFPDVVTGE